MIADECAISTERETVFSEYSDRGKNSDDQMSQNSSDIASNTPIVEQANTETINIECSEDETANKIRDRLLAEKRIIFKESNTTIGDVAEMISAFSCRFGIVLEARLKLFEMFRICAGTEFDNVIISHYMFSKVYDPPKNKVKLHFYCIRCTSSLLVTGRHAFAKDSVKELLCNKCSEQYQLSLGSPNCFQSIDLKYQIDQLLKRPEIARTFVDKIKSRNTQKAPHKICDVDDSEIYRNIVKKHPNAIIYTVATDGATAKNPLKCKTGFWPLQLMFNELPLSIRFKFITLVGVMILRKEPSPELLNLFLQSFVDQALSLSKEDILVLVDGETHTLRFIPSFFSVDSPARALIQNRIKHSGFYSCSFCYIKGFYAEGAVRFPCEVKLSELRSAESNYQDLENRSRSTSLELSRGVKGPSAFMNLLYFDIVLSFCFDYLHTVLLGPVADMISPDYHFSNSVIKKIDDRLMEIKPSHEVYTPPQKLSERSAWKGTGWKSWFLYFSLPMCIDLLPLNIMENYAALVKCMYTLLKIEILVEELDECQENLEKFLKVFQQLRGIGSMKFNIHMIRHIVQSIVRTGPIAVTSTFPFESNIGFLKNLVTGTKGLGLQMCMKSMQVMSYRCKARNFSSSPVVKAFCESLFQIKKFTLSAQIKKGVTFFGIPKISHNEDTVGAKIFTKCIYQKQTYHSVDYNRGSKFNDTIIQLECGSIAQILQIIDMPNDGECYFRVWKLESN